MRRQHREAAAELAEETGHHDEDSQVANPEGTHLHRHHLNHLEEGRGAEKTLRSPPSTGARGHLPRFGGMPPPSTRLTSFRPKEVGLHSAPASLKSRRVLQAPQRRQNAEPCKKTVSWGAWILAASPAKVARTSPHEHLAGNVSKPPVLQAARHAKHHCKCPLAATLWAPTARAGLRRTRASYSSVGSGGGGATPPTSPSPARRSTSSAGSGSACRCPPTP